MRPSPSKLKLSLIMPEVRAPCQSARKYLLHPPPIDLEPCSPRKYVEQVELVPKETVWDKEGGGIGDAFIANCE